MQIIVQIPQTSNEAENQEPNGANGKPTWAIVEMQGDLESRLGASAKLEDKFIGDLHFTKAGVPVLIIGHHILYGKATNLDKPFVVIRKAKNGKRLA